MGTGRYDRRVLHHKVLAVERPCLSRAGKGNDRADTASERLRFARLGVLQGLIRGLSFLENVGSLDALVVGSSPPRVAFVANGSCGHNASDGVCFS